MYIKGSRRYNYRHNTERVEAPGTGSMINGQGLGLVSKMRYGICHMSFNGCEVIAVQNALVFLGIPQPVAEVAFYMERFRLLMGFFGCNVYKIGKALAHFGAEYERAADPGDARAFIVSFWTGRPFLSPIHTVFCVRTASGIDVYNKYNTCPGVRSCQDIGGIIGKRKPIALYRIISPARQD